MPNFLIYAYLPFVFDTPCQSTRRIKFGLWFISGLRTLNCSECLKDHIILFSHARDGYRMVYC